MVSVFVYKFHFRNFLSVLQSMGAANILNNWTHLLEQAQLMVMMLDSNPIPTTFAESISSEFVNVYSDYCSTQRQMSETLSKKKAFDAEFNAKIESIESLPMSKGLKLESYLLIPMQRITKYPDLLRKVKKTKKDAPGIDQAIQKAEFLLSSVNSSVAVLEDASKLDWLLTHLQNPKGASLPPELSSVR